VRRLHAEQTSSRHFGNLGLRLNHKVFFNAVKRVNHCKTIFRQFYEVSFVQRRIVK
jgi:hypothetical protein